MDLTQSKVKTNNVFRRDRRLAAQLVAPAIVAIVTIIFFPLAYALYLSFHDYIISQGGIGGVNLTNYWTVLQDDLLFSAARNTLILTISTVTIELLGGFGLALLLNNKRLHERNIYLIILLIPMLMPAISVGLIWRLLLHPELGIINYLLGVIGIAQPAWLGNPHLAMLTVVFVDAWKETSFVTLILFSGLITLPEELFEAAMIDGANSFQKFCNLTLPMMIPNLLVATLIRLIAALESYDLIYILTRGGPGVKTETISYYIYRVAFVYLDIGKSSAMAFLLLLVIVSITMILMRVMRAPET